MAPTRRLKQRGQQAASNATTVGHPLKKDSIFPYPVSKGHNASHDPASGAIISRTSSPGEASHTLMTDDGKTIKIHSKSKGLSSGENDALPWDEPAVYSTNGTLCHSHSQLFPRKSARLVRSRPIKKSSRSIPIRVFEAKLASTNWPDARNAAEVAAFCNTRGLSRSNSIEDIEPINTPPRLTLDDLRGMRSNLRTACGSLAPNKTCADSKAASPSESTVDVKGGEINKAETGPDTDERSTKKNTLADGDDDITMVSVNDSLRRRDQASHDNSSLPVVRHIPRFGAMNVA